MWSASFVYWFRRNLIFDINRSTEFLNTLMSSFVAYLFRSNLYKSHARREIAIFSVKFGYFLKQTKSSNF